MLAPFCKSYKMYAPYFSLFKKMGWEAKTGMQLLKCSCSHPQTINAGRKLRRQCES